MSYLTLFQSISDDTFEVRNSSGSATVWNSGPAETMQHYVRRPMRGIVLAEETYASLSVMGGAAFGGLKNSSAPWTSHQGHYTTNFLLQSVTETRNEKVQYVSTFGSTYAFFFGEQPRIINCAAVLLNTPDFNWEKEWWTNYSDVLRGTSLTSRNTKATLTYDGATVVGYLTNATTIKNAQDPHLVNVNFSMFVESILFDSDVGSTQPYKTSDPTRADYLGVGSVIDPEDRRVLSESTTAAVRRANIQISPLEGGSSIGGLMGALSAIDGAISGFIRSARNMLYGRNIVVPRSFTGERASVPIFPEGSGAEDLAGGGVNSFWGKSLLTYSEDGVNTAGGTSVTLRSNTDGFLTKEYMLAQQRTKTHTYDNFDEYVNQPPRSSALKELYEDVYSDSFFGPELDLFALDMAAWSDDLYINEKAVEAFSAFGMGKAVLPYMTLGDRTDSTMAVVNYQSAKLKEGVAGVLRAGMRVVYGVATFAYGTSVVNKRKELQNSITNPNSGGLDAETVASMSALTASVALGTEQRRLAAEAEAASLRGNTGTVEPNLISVIGGILT